MFNQVKSFFKNEVMIFRDARTEIASNNLAIMKAMSLIYLFSLIFYFAFSFFYNGSFLESALVLFFIILQIMFSGWVWSLSMRESVGYYTVLLSCLIFAALIVVLGICIGVFSFPEKSGIVFYPIIILICLLYSIPIYVMTPLVLFYAASFLFLSFNFKPHDIFMTDLVGTVLALTIAFTSLITTAIIRHKNYKTTTMLRTICATDQLTGVFNKNTMELLCTNRLNAQGDEYIPSAFFILDIDNFKMINDSRGHLAGDEVLKSLSVSLKQIFEKYGNRQAVGRFGGDEFCVLLYSVSSYDEISKLCEQIIKRCGRCTCSIGVAISEDGESFKSLFKRADRALYNIKGSGKNGYEID